MEHGLNQYEIKKHAESKSDYLGQILYYLEYNISIDKIIADIVLCEANEDYGLLADDQSHLADYIINHTDFFLNEPPSISSIKEFLQAERRKLECCKSKNEKDIGILELKRSNNYMDQSGVLIDDRIRAFCCENDMFEFFIELERKHYVSAGRKEIISNFRCNDSSEFENGRRIITWLKDNIRFVFLANVLMVAEVIPAGSTDKYIQFDDHIINKKGMPFSNCSNQFNSITEIDEKNKELIEVVARCFHLDFDVLYKKMHEIVLSHLEKKNKRKSK